MTGHYTYGNYKYIHFKENTYTLNLDFNNRYGYDLSQPLSTDRFGFAEYFSMFKFDLR